MGGEKLKHLKPLIGILTIFILLTTFPLYAQDAGDALVPADNTASAETGSIAIDESAIFLGETSIAPIEETTSSFGVIIRMVLTLALAALAIYGVVFFIKRLSRPQESLNPHLRVLARVPLTNDTFAAVLSVGAKAWLIAGGTAGINLISEIDDTETLETMLIEDAGKIAEAQTREVFNFRSLLGRLGGQARENPHASNLRRQRERLGGS